VNKNIALSLENIDYSINYGFFLKKKEIIKNLSLNVFKGEIFGLVGSNGAGKTTTIKLGMGLLKPDNGIIKVFGISPEKAGSRKKIGFLTENQYVYPYLTLREWLEMLGSISGIESEKLKFQIKRVVSLVELDSFLNEKLKNLSKGQVQRAGIAQALLGKPSILVLDEPMSGLDPLWRHRIKKILKKFNEKGGTIIFSSHIMSDVLSLSNRIGIIEKGKLKWCGKIKDLDLNKANYQALFYSDDFSKLIQKDFKFKTLEKQAGNSWFIEFDSSYKKEFISLISKHNVCLEYLKPDDLEIEEMIFGNYF